MSDNNVVAFAFFMRMLAVIAAIVCAAWLAYKGKDGWGWLIFAAILMIPSVTTKTDAPKVEVKEPT
jgi:carbon starvation protein CstA